MSLLAFNLPEVLADHVGDGLEAAPFFTRFSDAGQHVIRSIHAIPKLFGDVERGEVEVYLGRAGATSKHVMNRFRDHRGSKDHDFGMVLFVGATDDVVSWEGTANRILMGLMARGQLCVANAVAGSQGRRPDEAESCVYLTWRLGPLREVGTAKKRHIISIAEDVADARSETRSASQLVTALDPLSRPTRDYAEVDWHRAHEDEDEDDEEDEEDEEDDEDEDEDGEEDDDE
jgi:hypothetical protein